MVIAADQALGNLSSCLASIAGQAYFPFASVSAVSESPFQQLADTAFRPPPDSVSSALIPVASVTLWFLLNSPWVSRFLPAGPDLGCPSGIRTSFSPRSCCFSYDMNYLRFCPTQCMLLSKSSSNSLLLKSQKAHHILACLIQMRLQYLFPDLVFPIQPYSQVEYR